MNERMLTGLTSVIQTSLGPWAEPVCARVARNSIHAMTGLRSARRMGIDWDLDLAQNHERELYAVGSYEAATVRRACQLLLPGEAALDVGANIGSFSLPVAARGHRVIAVEPASDTASRLRSHVSKNGLGYRVHVQQGALGSRSGTVQLRSGYGDDSGLRTTVGSGRPIESVAVSTGDELLHALRVSPALVKIDVEGSELDVLLGLSSTLRSVRAVIVEVVESHQERAGLTSNDLTVYLEEQGLERRDIRDAEPRPRLGRGGNNALFVRPGMN